MDLFEARQLAQGLMRQHGLSGWTFAFDRARRRFGSCRWQDKCLTLSAPLTFLNDSTQVCDTILHEIAHALTPGDGHGPSWRATCERIGADPRRCYTDEQVKSPPRRAAPYRMGCLGCGWWVDRHRRTRQRLVCRRCRAPVVLQARGAGGP